MKIDFTWKDHMGIVTCHELREGNIELQEGQDLATLEKAEFNGQVFYTKYDKASDTLFCEHDGKMSIVICI